jgi:Tfp pilus assembly protein PilO
MTVGLLKRIVVEKRVLVLPLAVVLLVNLGVYVAVVYPLEAEMRDARQRTDAADQTLRAAQQEQAAARAILVGKDRAAAELQKFYQDVLPADLAGARRATYLRLAQFAREANLRYQRSVFEPKADKDTTLSELQITLVLEGDYEHVRRFVYRLETAPEFLVIQNVSLAQGTEVSAPLVLTLSLATYFRDANHGH